MKIVYYPDLFINDETLLKQLLLSWSRVETIVPPSQKRYIDSYLRGEIRHETHFPLELYKQIYDVAGEPVVDFLEISDGERRKASDRMLDLLCNWNKDSKFYDELKVKGVEDLVGRTVEWYWMYHEKLERDLVEVMMQEQLVLRWGDGEIVGKQEVGKSYMSIIASELRRSRGERIITDDAFYIAASAGCELTKGDGTSADACQPIALTVPQAYLAPSTLKKLSWRDIFQIRKDLLPYSAEYFKDLETYQSKINALSMSGQQEEAFDVFREFSDRVTISFTPLAKEREKLIRLAKNASTTTLLTGIVLPGAALLMPTETLRTACEVGSIAVTSLGYVFDKLNPTKGFEYLENLSRKLDLSRLKGQISCLIPKSVKKLRK